VRTDTRAWLCVVLSVSLALGGCATVSTHTHPAEAGTAEAKVAIYWKDMSGERYHVKDMEIHIRPAGARYTQALTALSSVEGPVYFTKMPPGKYRLVVMKDGREYLKRDIRLKPDRQTSVRVNVTGRKLAGDAAQVAGAVLVVAAAAAFFVAIAYLNSELDYEPRSRDDGPLIEINFTD